MIVGDRSGRAVLHRNDRGHDERGTFPAGSEVGGAARALLSPIETTAIDKRPSESGTGEATNFGTYSGRRPAQGRSQPVPVGHGGAVRDVG